MPNFKFVAITVLEIRRGVKFTPPAASFNRKPSPFRVKLYADDTFLCAENNDSSLLENEVNLELRKVYEWMRGNKLTLNILKSKSMIITNKRNISKNVPEMEG